jgi:ketosteroid isomerase-like protein
MGDQRFAGEAANVTHKAMAAINTRDMDSLALCFSPDAQLHAHFGPPLPFGGSYQGRTEIIDYFKQRAQLIPIISSKWMIELCSPVDWLIFGINRYSERGSDKVLAAPGAMWCITQRDYIVELNSFIDSHSLFRLLKGEGHPLPPERRLSGVNSPAGLVPDRVGRLSEPPKADHRERLSAYLQGGLPGRSALHELLDSSVEWHHLAPGLFPAAALTVGRDNTVAAFAAFESVYELCGHRTLRTAQAEDSIALHLELDLRSRQSAERRAVHCFQALTLHGGKIVRGFEVCDSLSLQQI